MSDDWQAGDLALCTYDGEWFAQNVSGTYNGPNPGSVTVVVNVRLWEGEAYLNFAAWPRQFYAVEFFRKLRGHDPDEFDREVIEQMNGAPVGEPVA